LTTKKKDKATAFTIRPLTPSDRDWVRRKIVEAWDAEIVVVHGEVFRPAEFPGFAACAGDAEEDILGLLTYRMDEDACEIMTLNSWCEGTGTGTALIEAARKAAKQGKCRRLFLVTTNDNTAALRFYQKQGFTIAGIRLDVMEQSRKLKPEIPPTGADGIPIRDEIELEMFL
jgi:N-acetylglutamate synthase-like GNAT family acetyltransferase